MSTSGQRVLDALELREPDTVPVFDLMMEPALVYRALGAKPTPVDRLLADPRISRAFDRLLPWIRRSPLLERVVIDRSSDSELEHFAHASVDAGLKLGFDAVGVAFYSVFKVESSTRLTDIFGRSYDASVTEEGFLSNPIYRGGLIDGPDAWESLDKRPFFRLPARSREVFGDVERSNAGRLFTFGLVSSGLFETTWQAMGFDRFAVAVRRNREFVVRVLKFFEDFICMTIEAMADAGMPGFICTDDLAYRTGPMLNPKTLRELLDGPYRRFVDTAHTHGMKVLFHSCGNTTELLGWLASCGFDAINPLEPTAGMSLAAAKQAVGDRMCLVGNIDVTRVLVDAPKDEVFEAVERAIADAGEGGGFMLSAGHDHPAMSLDRLRWMVEAARLYGRYTAVSGGTND